MVQGQTLQWPPMGNELVASDLNSEKESRLIRSRLNLSIKFLLQMGNLVEIMQCFSKNSIISVSNYFFSIFDFFRNFLNFEK